ncbi:bacteriocin [Pseudoalteromonas sp. Of7M-16]|uniref:bacteriocin n=1 Tax=Pseudoalteromonas sp. Of7M-16 TaxID=2917756 RepID=UPI001EF49E33|nr:bacteriocin [Pseudoalteromonas sp. Of7M-16]MCG7550977.1 bacteriocin [Pseudoalteromonas sp. Of7M-16]
MKVLSQNELKKVIGGIAGGGNQGGDPYEKPKKQSVIDPDPIKEPVLKTGG